MGVCTKRGRLWFLYNDGQKKWIIQSGGEVRNYLFHHNKRCKTSGNSLVVIQLYPFHEGQETHTVSKSITEWGVVGKDKITTGLEWTGCKCFASRHCHSGKVGPPRRRGNYRGGKGRGEKDEVDIESKDDEVGVIYEYGKGPEQLVERVPFAEWDGRWWKLCLI